MTDPKYEAETPELNTGSGSTALTTTCGTRRSDGGGNESRRPWYGTPVFVLPVEYTEGALDSHTDGESIENTDEKSVENTDSVSAQLSA